MYFYLNFVFHQGHEDGSWESSDLNIGLSDLTNHALSTKISNLNSVSVSSNVNPSDQNPFSLSDLHMALRKKKTFENMVQLRENV